MKVLKTLQSVSVGSGESPPRKGRRERSGERRVAPASAGTPPSSAASTPIQVSGSWFGIQNGGAGVNRKVQALMHGNHAQESVLCAWTSRQKSIQFERRSTPRCAWHRNSTAIIRRLHTYSYIGFRVWCLGLEMQERGAGVSRKVQAIEKPHLGAWVSDL